MRFTYEYKFLVNSHEQSAQKIEQSHVELDSGERAWLKTLALAPMTTRTALAWGKEKTQRYKNAKMPWQKFIIMPII